MPRGRRDVFRASPPGLIVEGASLRAVAELLGDRWLRMMMRDAHLSPPYLSAEVGR
jgi:hypothetical protein